MFKKVRAIFHKTKSRGFGWLKQRLILEFRIPETWLGKKLKPINVWCYRFFGFLRNPLNLFRRQNAFVPDALYLFYDLEVSPITFNFAEALCMANLKRQHLKLSYLYVVIVPGPHGGLRKEMADYEQIIHKEARQWRIFNLVLPLIHLMPACIGYTYCATREEAEAIRKEVAPRVYPEGYSTLFPLGISFFEGGRTSSMEMMGMQATPQALIYLDQWLEQKSQGRKVIVITLRQYAYMTQRNSNVEAWAKFAASLAKDEYFVVIVPDTEMAMTDSSFPLKGFQHFTEACWNVELRIALYEKAYLNLGINNGPFALCWLNRWCRYIMFKIITEEVMQTTEAALRNHGFIPNEDPPFSTQFQKWIWEPDSLAIIHKAFNSMVQLIEKENIHYANA